MLDNIKIPGKYHVPLLVLISSIAFLPDLAKVSPPTIMEARNFISAREMLQSENWLIPTLNGNIRIKKPPFPVWMTAASIYLADDHQNLFALRLPAILMGVLMVFFLYKLANDIFNDTQISFFSAAVLASSYMIIEQSRTGAWDIYCHSFMLGAIWMLFRAAQRKNLRYWTGAGFMLGASFLSKAPVSFYAMLLPFLIAFFYAKYSFKPISRKGLLICLFISLFLIISWPLYLFLKIPDLATIVLEEETGAWINRHTRLFWYYFHFPIFLGIWALPGIFALFWIKKLKSFFTSKKVILIFVWFLATFILLSLVPEKKERFFLPALAPLAILVGLLIRYHLELFIIRALKKGSRIMLVLQTIVVIIAAITVPAFIWLYGVESGKTDLWQFFIYLFISSGIILILGYMIKVKKLWLVYPLSLFMMLLFCVSSWKLLPYFRMKNENYTDLRRVKEIEWIQDKPLYTAEELNPIRIWEIGRKVEMMDSTEQPFPNTVFISKEPVKGAKKVITFQPHPRNPEETLYFYLY